MDYFASRDPRSYSFYFDLNISFLARKVIETIEETGPSWSLFRKSEGMLKFP